MSNSMGKSISEISVKELAQKLAHSTQPLQLLDVREPQEVAIASLANFNNLPLSAFADWSDQIQEHLDPQTEIIVLCHHGIRSAQMCYWLLRQGFTNVKNVSGGIDAYSLQVDSKIPRY